MRSDLSRREFTKAAAAGALGASLLPERVTAETGKGGLPPNSLVLFQGDSITDANRNRTLAGPNVPPALGSGYALLIAAAVLREHPDQKYRFLNRGVSGNKVPDLQARWQTEAVELAPDLLSVLIGVNDFWHTLRTDGYNGTVADYEKGYAELLASTRAALPQVRLVILEPFVLRAGVVDARWFPEFDERRAVAQRVAKQAGAVFVPLQDTFDKLATRTGAEYWAADGVHPTPGGHAVIAERWRRAVGI
jgi:lysophospholipase L1-like esterase